MEKKTSVIVIVGMAFIVVFCSLFSGCGNQNNANVPVDENSVDYIAQNPVDQNSDAVVIQSQCYNSELSSINLFKCRHAEEYHIIPASLIELVGEEAFQQWREKNFGNSEEEITRFNAAALIDDFNITKEAYMENQSLEGTVGLLSHKTADILFSGDPADISRYYTDLSKIVCFHRKDFHLIDKELLDNIEIKNALESWNDMLSQSDPEKRNIKEFIDYFQIPKEEFIQIIKNTPYDYNADILYDELSDVLNYYKDPRMKGCGHSPSYHTIDARLLEYVGYYASPEAAYWANKPDSSKIQEAFLKLDQKEKWIAKYKNDPEGINIVNFVKDHKITKADFEKLVRDSNLDYNADIIYSNDLNRIENYYKIRMTGEEKLSQP